MKHVAILALALLLASAGPGWAQTNPPPNIINQAPEQNLYLKDLFGAYNGTFVLYEPRRKFTRVYNPAQSRIQQSPCSTFKIPNSLIGLDTGVLSGSDTALPWDGQKRMLEAWNQDHTLQTAFRDSVVWYYQEVARRVGTEHYRKQLDTLNYGNQDMSGGLTQFWLDSSLKISAREQVNFLDKLIAGQLPSKPEHQELVRQIMRQEEGKGYVLYGKTGSASRPNNQLLGWYVGYLERPEGPYIFATWIEGADQTKGQKFGGYQARELTKKVLGELGLI